MSTQAQEVGFTPPYFDIIRVGNVGTQFNVQLMKVNDDDPNNIFLEPINLSNGTVQIDLRKPNGTIIELPAIKTNPPGVDGRMHYIDLDGLFTVRSRWALRGVFNL